MIRMYGFRSCQRRAKGFVYYVRSPTVINTSIILSFSRSISNVITMTRHAKSYNILPIIGIPTPSFNLNELNYVREDYSECLRSFQNTLINFCNESEIEYIDFSLHMTSNHVIEDGLHPNAEGHKIMMENAKELLTRLL